MWSAPTAHPLTPCFHPAAVVFPLLLFCCSSHVEIRAFSCVTSPFLGPRAPLPLWQSVMVWLTSTPSQRCPPLASVTRLSCISFYFSLISQSALQPQPLLPFSITVIPLSSITWTFRLCFYNSDNTEVCKVFFKKIILLPTLLRVSHG